jgi:hypothetical protein
MIKKLIVAVLLLAALILTVNAIRGCTKPAPVAVNAAIIPANVK